MKRSGMSKMALVVVVASVLFVVAGQAGAAPVNVLLGKVLGTADRNGFTDLGANPPTTAMTDGNNSSGLYVSWYQSSTANYDLGATYAVDTLGVYSQTFGSRNHPATMTLNFFSDNTYSGTPVASRTVALANQDYDLVAFTSVEGARYVQFLTPYQSEYTTNPDTTFGFVSEIELYQVVPEPATLCLLGLGAIGLLRRRSR